MQMTGFRLARRIFLAASITWLACLGLPAWSFTIPVSQLPVRVVEYYNVDLAHYFPTADSS
jgi:hypothetical protein